MTNVERAQRIKLLVMDVDGTLTDGAMYFSDRGEELKRFSTRDGMGITLLHRAGIMTAI
ncbi:MAG: acylneuraminate cytidylyltransferase, partial [Candidatus Kapabacteria bacterium]|nr:acylneuraminate cytidylyltransferase [Candidatus Kapabacteria bacterium]